MKKLFFIIMLLSCAILARATVWINGVELKSYTTTSSSTYGIKSGSVRLAGSILTLINVNIDATGKGIESDQGLTIYLQGTNTIKSVGAGMTLASTKNALNFTIKGDDCKGKLTVTSTDAAALRNENAKISIEMCDVTLTGAKYTVWSQQSTITEIINVTNAHVTFNNTSNTGGTVQKLAELNMTGCSLANGHIFRTNSVRTSSGSLVTGTVEIKPDNLPFKVKGVQATTLNKDDILGDGTVYVWSKNMLYLKNANISYAGRCIDVQPNSDSYSYIYFEGDNTIRCTSSSYDAIYCPHGLRINTILPDNTSVNISNSNTTAGSAIHVLGDLIIEGIKANISGYRAISNLGYTTDNKLSLFSTELLVTRTGSGYPVYGFSSVAYSGCVATVPSCLTYNTSGRYFTSNGSNISQFKVVKGNTENISPTIHSLSCTSKSYYSASFSWNAEDNMTAKENLSYRYTLAKGAGTSAYIICKESLSKGVTSYTLNNLAMGTTYSFTLEAKDENGNVNYKTVQFSTPVVPNYDITVMGELVTQFNYDDILGDGRMSYSPSTNVLTIYDYSGSINAPCIKANRNLTVRFEGHVNFKSFSNNCLEVGSGYTVTFDADDDTYINLESDELSPISAGSNVVFSQGRYTLTGPYYLSTTGGTLTVVNAHVKGTMARWTNLRLTGYAEIIQSNGEYFDQSKKAICNQNGDVASFIKIGIPEYDVEVADIKVNKYNCEDVLDDGGSVSYNPEARRLILKNANIVSGTNPAIEANGRLDILLVGENKVVSDNNPIRVSNGPLTIVGGSKNYAESTLTVFSTSSKPCIVMSGSTFTIRDCFVTANGQICNMSNLPMYVDNAYVHSDNLISDFSDVLMTNAFVNSETDCHYDTTRKMFVVNNITPVKNVTIIPVPVTINDINVTRQNASNIVNGASYDFNTKTLKLNNVEVYTIQSWSDINIEVEGTNYIKYSSENVEYGLRSLGNTYMYGSGKLYVQGHKYDMLIDGHMRVSDCLLDAWASFQALKVNGTLTFDAANVSLSNIASNACCMQIEKLRLYDCEIVNPEGMNVNNWQNYTNQLQSIRVLPTRSYDIKVAGIEVNDINKNDILDDGGSVKYDSKTNTLTLTDAYISTFGDWGIFNNVDDLTLRLVGETNFDTSGAIYANKPMSIEGNDFEKDILRITTGRIYCASDMTLSIKNCSVYAKTMGCSIGTEAYIYVDFAHVESDVYNIKDVYINNAYITKGYRYSTEINYFVNSDGTAVKDAVITPITLYISDTYVTDNNCNDIFGDGTASYDIDTKTLTLNNAHIENETIRSYTDLTIKLEGENTMTVTDPDKNLYAIQIMRGDLTVNGPGSLDINNYVSGISRWAYESQTITLKNCDVNIACVSFGLVNNSGGITFNNANVELSSDIPIAGKTLTLTNCKPISHTESELTSNIFYGFSNTTIRVSKMYIPGDFDTNGVVDIKDIVLLIKQLNSSGKPRYYIYKDANCDGKVNIKDVEAIESILLKK